MNRVPSYEQRVARMKTVQDIDKELRRAKSYMMRLRTRCHKAVNLDTKLQLQKDLKKAEAVLRKIRANIYELEDQLDM